MTNTTACIDGYVHAWNHVCNQKQAKDWPNNEVPCPTTFKREAINDTLPAKVPKVQSLYFRRLINVLLMNQVYVVQRELPNLFHVIALPLHMRIVLTECLW